MNEAIRKCSESALTAGALLESYCHFFLNYCYINLVCLGFESPTGLSPSPSAPAWQGRRVASSKLWMLEFSAFLEQQQDQDTVRNTPCFHPSLILHLQADPVHHGYVILLLHYCVCMEILASLLFRE